MDEKTKISQESNLQEENIFDEFAQENHLQEEVKKSPIDIYTYSESLIKGIQACIVIILSALLLLGAYVLIQKNENFSSSPLLDPVCFLFIGDLSPAAWGCSSITVLKNRYDAELSAVQSSQSEQILNLLDTVYQVKNFHKTKSVVFVSEKTNNKLPVSDILSAFDDIKAEFDTVEKNKIQCNNITIEQSGELIMTCNAYSAWFEKGIKGFDANRANVEGTSISIANSFLNFIEKKSDEFTLMNRQKVFRAQKLIGDQTWYTLKTSFSVHLKYKTNNLSL